MSAPQHTVTAALWTARAKAGKEAQVRELLSHIVVPARHDPGNIDYEVHEDESRPGTFVIYERWTSHDALDEHMRSSWIPQLIPPLVELLEGNVEDELRFLRPVRPAR